MTRRWIVDAMNVIGSRPDKWWNDPDRAMRRFADELADFAAKTGDEVRVVFDKRPARLDEPDGVEVIVARWKGRNAADHEIEELVDADADPGSLTVVTSDRRLVDNVAARGARIESSGAFRKRLDRFS